MEFLPPSKHSHCLSLAWFKSTLPSRSLPCWKRFAIIPRPVHTTHWELYMRKTAAQHARSQLLKGHCGWNREIGRHTITLALRF